MRHPRPKIIVSPWYIFHIPLVALVGFFGYGLADYLTPERHHIPFIYIFLFVLTSHLLMLAHELGHALTGRHLGLRWEKLYIGLTKCSVWLEDTPMAYRSNKNQIRISFAGPFIGLTTAALLVAVPLLLGQHWTNPITLSAAISIANNLLALAPFQHNSDGRKLLKATWRTLRGKGQDHFFYQDMQPVQIGKTSCTVEAESVA